MPRDPFIYRDWIEEFRREVEAELARPRAPRKIPKDPAARVAVEGFNAWWAGEYGLPDSEDSLQSLQTNKELELSRMEVAALRRELERARTPTGGASLDLLEQIRKLTEERERFQEELRALKEENRSLRRLQETAQEQAGALRLRAATARAETEGKVQLLQEHIDSLTDRAAALEQDLQKTRAAKDEAERALDAQSRRLAEIEALRSQLAGLRSELEVKLETAAEFLELKIRAVQEQSKGNAQHQLHDLVEALQRLRGHRP